MADIRPFPGLRPRPDVVERVASPPYDVLSSQEARTLAAENPLSFLRVVKAEIDLDPELDVHSNEVYHRSVENFRRMIDEGVLVPDPKPCLYVYELTMGEHVQRGLVVGASVEEYVSGAIKKHEHTRRDKEDDRARHVEMLQANAGPVLFTYRARGSVRDRVTEVCGRKAVFDFTADDGVRHRLWQIDAPAEIDGFRQEFEAVKALYVADGHHRSASAFRVRDILRAKNPGHTGDEAYNHFLAVLFPDDELQIMGYHRVVADLNGMDDETYLKRVAEKFSLTPTDQAQPDQPHSFGMFLSGKWYRLEALPGSYPPDDPVRSLDASILQDNLLAPVLGIGDPRSDKRVDFVGGIRGTGELQRRCGVDMRVAFALHPVSVTQLMAIADSGAIMPPKSTWFEPKLRSGVVVRSLQD